MARYVADNEQQKINEKVPMTQTPETSVTEKVVDPYAHMFADWDLLPPQMVIRRIRRTAQ